MTPDPAAASRDGWTSRLRHAIEHAAHLLPAQGPITVFIHHNTLHAFEPQPLMPFEVAVEHGAELFGCQPYLSEEDYRTALRRGRIRVADLRAVLHADLKGRDADPIFEMTSRLELRLAMLQAPIWALPDAELAYYLAESDAFRRVRPDAPPAIRSRLVAETRRWAMRDLRGRSGPHVPGWSAELFQRFPGAVEEWDDARWEAFALESLWRVCQEGARHAPEPERPARTTLRLRDRILEACGIDTDLFVHDLLIRACAAFLDQGIAHAILPNRSEGFFRAFLQLYAQPAGPPDAWMAELPALARRGLDSSLTPLDSIHESLEILGVPETAWNEFLSETLLALRGWGGMVHQVEKRGDSIAQGIPRGSFLEFVAVRLLLDRIAAEWVVRNEWPECGSLEEFRARIPAAPVEAEEASCDPRAFTLFQIAQLLGWTPSELWALKPDEWAKLVGEIEDFGPIERCRTFHRAYERRFRQQVLDAVSLNPRTAPADERPRFQLIACIDEREESFRRHLEEVAPDAETLGVAGFFNVAMYYRGVADAHFVPQCPIVLTPGHWVEECVVDAHASVHERQRRTRQAFGAVSHRLQKETRSFALGAVLAGGLGLMASLPLVVRVLFPRWAFRIRREIGRFMNQTPETRLQLERGSGPPGPKSGHLGFSIDEMTAISGRLLRDIGLTRRLARIVVVLGHGSSSLNNPHRSAYDCGACGGSSGAPNARALAHMLNDPRVRARLVSEGILIPEDTWFVGAFHNTCDDSVIYFDESLLPEFLRAEFDRMRHEIGMVRDRNAHERCRRFMSAPLNLTPEEARRHVENRREDLAQVRPELGHATNAICVVGRRERTRGLFLDRRAFLASYDPTQDDDAGSTLARILGAAVPVCGGINLEYFFSRVDSPGYGCGSKLPHNVSALLGVMDGAASDLRTGLPWQMVEIHEPMRLLFVVETRPEILRGILQRMPAIDTMIRNGWVQMTLLDPNSSTIRIFREGEFVVYRSRTQSLPAANSSMDWYRGWRDHLEIARISREGETSHA